MENEESARGVAAIPKVAAVKGDRFFVRLNYSERGQHIIFAICFIKESPDLVNCYFAPFFALHEGHNSCPFLMVVLPPFE